VTTLPPLGVGGVPSFLLVVPFVLLLLPTVGLWGSYWALFATYCLIQLNANVAQGPYQGFIPDIIPEEKRGRASAAKALAETAGGAIAVLLVGSTIDRYILGQGNVYLYLTLLIPWAMLLLAALVTIFTVREPPVSNPERISLAEAFSRSFKIEAKLRSSFLFFLVSRLLVFMAFTTLQRFAFYYLGDVLEVPQPASATAQFTVTAVAGLLLAIYPAGLLSDKVGRKAFKYSFSLYRSYWCWSYYSFQGLHRRPGCGWYYWVGHWRLFQRQLGTCYRANRPTRGGQNIWVSLTWPLPLPGHWPAL